MKRFIEGENRFQATLFPESLDDYIADDNPVRAIDAFVDGLDLKALGFEGAEPALTGRPAYEPAMMLKIYVYGYMNKLKSTRVLEQETHRNVDVLWLTGRLMPDHKTIGEFRRKNRKAIRRVCVAFVEICRKLDLFSGVIVAIDGSKFKGVSSRDKNFTRKSVKRRKKHLQEHIERYLRVLDAADKREAHYPTYTADELKAKIASMQEQMRELEVIEAEVEVHPDKQVSRTDPDSRSMTKAGGGTEVGYNVQVAVDGEHHMIVAHEATKDPTDRAQLSSMAKQAKAAVRGEESGSTDKAEAPAEEEAFTVVADAGYYKGEEIVACQDQGITPLVPKVDTSGKRTKGQFTREMFRYDEDNNVYRCPAGQDLSYSFSTKEKDKLLHVYMTNQCQGCELKAKCTTGKGRRIRRWEHEHRLEAAAAALKRQPDAMRLRKQIVEHPFGTIKHWMGATHFVMKRLENVQAEMSLYVLGYNLKRAIAVLGMPKLMEALEAA